MFNVPIKLQKRFLKAIPRFQKILHNAKIRDLNESDTVLIITDILSDVFGYDKYIEVTSELAIRGTYCDLAINLDGNIQFIIEVKAIGKTLRDMHLKQAVDYGANKGIPWVILTNGLIWKMYKIKFEKPISFALVYEFDFLDISPKNKDTIAQLYLLCKESLSKNARESFFEKIQNINRYTVGQIILSETVIRAITRDIKKVGGGVKISPEEVQKIIQEEVLKRDIVEGEEADEALAKIKKAQRANKRVTKKTATEPSNLLHSTKVSDYQKKPELQQSQTKPLN